MPFLSKAQARACYAQRSRLARLNKRSKWNCEEYSRHTDYSKLPERTSKRRSKRSKRSKRRSKRSKRRSKRSKRSISRRSVLKKTIKFLESKGRKIYTGAKGGKYIMSKGRKIYL
jgi:hypothetical protein